MDPLKEIDQAQLSFFEKKNAKKLLLNFAKKGGLLCKEAQVKIFKMSPEDSKQIIEAYIKHWALHSSAQAKLIKHPDADLLVALYNVKFVMSEKIRKRWYNLKKRAISK